MTPEKDITKTTTTLCKANLSPFLRYFFFFGCMAAGMAIRRFLRWLFDILSDVVR